MILGVIAGVVFLCMGLPLAGGLVWYFSADDEVADQAVDVGTTNDDAEGAEAADSGGSDDGKGSDTGETDEDEEKAKAEAARKAEADKKKSAGSSSSRRRGSSSSSNRGSSSSADRGSSSSSRRRSSGSSGGSSSSSRRRGSSSSGSSSSGSSSGSSGGASFPATVRFVHQGAETTLSCGDGQQRTFVGSTRMTFNEIATCRVDSDGKRTVVQVRKGGTSTCSTSSGKLRCSSP